MKKETVYALKNLPVYNTRGGNARTQITEWNQQHSGGEGEQTAEDGITNTPEQKKGEITDQRRAGQCVLLDLEYVVLRPTEIRWCISGLESTRELWTLHTQHRKYGASTTAAAYSKSVRISLSFCQLYGSDKQQCCSNICIKQPLHCFCLHLSSSEILTLDCQAYLNA